MAATTVQYTIDEDLKKEFEQTCKDMGLKPSAVFQLFANVVVQERKIPFEIKADSGKENVE